MLRTESPDRKPPSGAHLKTPDRAYPIQPLPPAQSSVSTTEPTVWHYPRAGASSSRRVPYTSSPVPSPTPAQARQNLLAGKLELQRHVESQLGITRIPSPTFSHTRSVFDAALAFFYSDKNGERDPGEEDLD